MAVRFAVGDKERHTISVETSLLSKFITIEMDGQPLIRDWHPSPFAKTFHFNVGSTENHHVELRVGPFTVARVLVDDKPVQPLP
jgi:hypothetical protein